jgi:integrase
MRANFTASFVQAVKPPTRGQMDYWDSRVTGFGLRVAPSGRKSWFAFYRHRGRNRRVTVGVFPALGLADARRLAQGVLRDAAHGLDPGADKQAGRMADNFGDLAARYLAEYAAAHNRPRTLAEKRKLLKAEILPRWRALKVEEIKRRDVIALADSIAARGASIYANRALALASSIFAFAVSKEVIDQNPAYRVPKPGREQARDRVLSEAETRMLWLALDDEPLHVAALFRLGLLTAQRRGELLGAAWTEIDFDSGWWTIPGARTKNRLTHRVPLTPQVVSMLRELHAKAADGAIYVFPGPSGTRPLSEPKKWIARLRQRGGVDFWFHDLRRTAATHMASAGVARLVISKILNHVEAGVTKIYERYSYDTEKRAALIRWERRLLEIVTDTRASKVVELRGAH